MTKPSEFPLRLSTALCFLLLFGCQANLNTPVALEPEDACAYCKMAISEKRYATELIDSGGEAFKFDDIGCMINFVKRGGVKGATYFVMDFDDRAWIKADEAFYISSSEFTTPMNGGIVAFKDQGKAQQAVDKYHGKLLRFKDILVL